MSIQLITTDIISNETVPVSTKVTDSFTRNKYENGKFIIERVQQTSYSVEQVSGNATVTHVGAYGQIKFIFNDVIYFTIFVYQFKK